MLTSSTPPKRGGGFIENKAINKKGKKGQRNSDQFNFHPMNIGKVKNY